MLSSRTSHRLHKACQAGLAGRRCFRSAPAACDRSTPPKPVSQADGEAPPATTHFGFKDIPSSMKESLVGGVFSSVASSYDVMNDVMSLGVHRVWKDSFVRRLSPGRRGGYAGQRILDVAGGTGDIALRHLDHATDVHFDSATDVHVVDINGAMLTQGMIRARATRYYDASVGRGNTTPARTPEHPESDGRVGPRLRFSVGNAEDLDFIEDNSIDIYTIAFGIRNVTHIDRVLKEAYRVLKPGGVFSCLEFSSVRPVKPLVGESFETARGDGYGTSRFYGGEGRDDVVKVDGAWNTVRSAFSRVYEGYSFSVIPLMGELVAGDRASYQYLVESIARFPDQERFAGMIADAGFSFPGVPLGHPIPSGSLEGKAYHNLSLGIAAIHTGIKPVATNTAQDKNSTSEHL
ncbi:2-hexaprenyl-6-methoxy-1,4-benzoquinone methyltransferase [Savitreella phatthalungensis]